MAGCTAVRWLRVVVLALAVASGVSACGASAGGSTAPARAAPRAGALGHWRGLVHVLRPLDLAGPRADGSPIVAAHGRLELLSPAGGLRAYAPVYRSPGGEEPYIAFSPGTRSGPCRWPAGAVYAIRLHAPRGVVAVNAAGRVAPFARIGAPGLIDGIAFDRAGRFGHRLLVTVDAGPRTTVVAIDCRGAVSTVTRHAPRVEGGIAVAPASFGRFGGDLIAPDERSGRIYAIAPTGASRLVADSGLPHGGDIGVESEAFVPPDPRASALLADRLTPGNRHPGDDLILILAGSDLRRAGVRPGDLLVATEGGASADAVRCGARGCVVRQVADGPKIAHGEGHIAFARVSVFY